MSRSIVLTLIILNLYKAQGQNIEYFGFFPTLDHSGKISDRWSYNVYLFDAIKPYSNTINKQHDEARSLYAYGEAGLSYALTNKLSMTAAYVHERQNPFSDDYRSENRLFQQLTLKLPIGNKTELKQRLRFDERFISNRTTGKRPLTHRLRYLIGIKQGLGNEKLYLLAYSEAFFNTSRSFKLDENWTAMQLGIRLNERNSIEVGPLYIGWIINAQNDWLRQYYLQAAWVSQIDFSKQK